MFEIYGESEEIQDLSRFNNFNFDINESFFGPHAYVAFNTQTKGGLKYILRCDLILPSRHEKSIGKGTLLTTISSYIPGDETTRITTLGPVYKKAKDFNIPYVTHAPNVITYGINEENSKVENISIKIAPQRSFDSEELQEFVIEDRSYIKIKTQKKDRDFIIVFSRQTSEDTAIQYIASYYGLIEKDAIESFEYLGTILKLTSVESIKEIQSKKARVWDTLGGEIKIDKKSNVNSQKKVHNVILQYKIKDKLYAKIDNYISHQKENDQVKIAFVSYNPFTNIFERDKYRIQCLKNVENSTWSIDKYGVYHGAINRKKEKNIELAVHTPRYEALTAGIQAYLTYNSKDNIKLFKNIWKYSAPHDCDLRPATSDMSNYINLGPNQVYLSDKLMDQFKEIEYKKDRLNQAREFLSLACKKLQDLDYKKVDDLVEKFQNTLK